MYRSKWGRNYALNGGNCDPESSVCTENSMAHILRPRNEVKNNNSSTLAGIHAWDGVPEVCLPLVLLVLRALVEGPHHQRRRVCL